MSRPIVMPDWVQCPSCKGTGQLVEARPVQPGKKLAHTPCPECQGEGKVPPKG